MRRIVLVVGCWFVLGFVSCAQRGQQQPDGASDGIIDQAVNEPIDRERPQERNRELGQPDAALDLQPDAPADFVGVCSVITSEGCASNQRCKFNGGGCGVGCAVKGPRVEGESCNEISLPMMCGQRLVCIVGRCHRFCGGDGDCAPGESCSGVTVCAVVARFCR